MQVSQPKLIIDRTVPERISDFLSVLLLAGATVLLALHWRDIPAEIPIHFNGKGEPDRYGGKAFIWAPMALASVMWMVLTLLERYPHVYNYINLTEANREKQYLNARMMINLMKLEIVLFFVCISAEIYAAGNYDFNLLAWGMPVFLLLLALTLAFFINRARKL
ncbi:DUF1648 domain-containing protein [Paenibacillus lutrae]|uniref:DUF1648 domain-containing protein n=1 Tax=Paenibacillus lutrae TaxID=2078573 RepID=A0A7X3K002_9BACL|nr:DUF1648 domain-containing protein [Paenibacillus lutrae]MVP00595.1 DUF1648 domain-containing protein [Paenibacillus lutrae]